MQSQTKKLLILILMGTVITAAATAGGNQESPAEEQSTEQSDPGSSRIEIEEGNRVDQDENDAEQDEDREQSDEPIWALVDHPLEQDIVRNISGVIDDGYAPVGFDETSDAISMLYAKSDRVIFDRWIIHEFTDLSNLNEDFSAFLLEGWTPMDISVTDSGLSTLFVRGEDNPEIAGWRIHEIAVEDLQSVFTVLEEYRDGGFLPYGVSIDQENQEFWFLLVQLERSEDSEPARVAFNAFEEGDTEEGITSDIENGLLPWGLARGRESTFVLYLF